MSVIGTSLFMPVASQRLGFQSFIGTRRADALFGAATGASTVGRGRGSGGDDVALWW